MEVSFRKIFESEFESDQSSPILFYDSSSSRCFGIVKFGETDFKFGWQSDLLEPVIKEIKEGIYAIGIDQNFAIVDFLQNKVCFSVNLTYNFCAVEHFKNNIFICTELEIIIINKEFFNIVQSISLPDYFETLVFENTKVKVICVGSLVIEQNI